MRYYYTAILALCSASLLAATPPTTSEANNRQLLEAVRKGQEEKVKELLKKGTDPNIQQADGDTVLIFAAQGGHAKTVQILDLAKKWRTKKNKRKYWCYYMSPLYN